MGPSPTDWGWYCGLSPALALPECFWRLHLTYLERFNWADLSPFAQKYQAFKFPLSSKLRRLAENSAEFISEVFWNIKQLTCLSSYWTEFQKKKQGIFWILFNNKFNFTWLQLMSAEPLVPKKPYVVCRIHRECRNNMPSNKWLQLLGNLWQRNYARVQDASLCTFRCDSRSFSAGRYVAKLKFLSEKSRVNLLKRITIFLS